MSSLETRQTAEVAAAAALSQLDRRPLPVGAEGTVGGSLVEFSVFDAMDPALREQLVSDETPFADRCKGAMLGMAVGDAVGSQVEFLEVGSGEAAFDAEGCCYTGSVRNMFGFKPGQWTDDTSMGLCLADSLLCCGKFDGSDFMARLWNWNHLAYNNGFRYDLDRAGDEATRAFMIDAGLDADACRQSLGCGRGTRSTLANLEEGAAPPAVHEGGEYEGNGSLIRLAPVPVFCARQSAEECMAVARASALATQNGPVTSEAAAFLAFVMRRAILRGEDGRSFREFLDDAIMEYSAMLTPRADEAAVAAVLKLLASAEDEASTEVCWNWRSDELDVLKAFANRGESYNGHQVKKDYFGAYAMDGLAVALWAAYHADSPTAAIAKATNVLGDADSMACIAGQLAGSFYGARSFDPRLVAQLRQWDPDCETELRGVLLSHCGASLPHT